MPFHPARFSLPAIALSLAGCERAVEPPLVYSPEPTVVDLIQTLRNTDGTFATRRHAWLATKLTGDSTVTPDFSAIGASHKIHVFGSSRKGTEHDWTARQVWLNLPDRTLGLLDLSPNANLTAYEVQGAIRLGYGGTAYSATKTLVATGPNAWNYGDLR